MLTVDTVDTIILPAEPIRAELKKHRYEKQNTLRTAKLTSHLGAV